MTLGMQISWSPSSNGYLAGTVCMCLYVRMCAYKCACMNMYTHASVIYIYVHTVSIFVHIHMCTYTCAHSYCVYEHEDMCTHTFASMWECGFAHVCVLVTSLPLEPPGLVMEFIP